MKIILIFLFFCLNCYSQNDKVVINHYLPSNTSDTFYVDKYWKLNTPGQELKKASREFYTGLTLNLVGSSIFLLSTNINSHNYASYNDYKNDRNFLRVTGGSLLLIGLYYSIHSNIHLKRAGIIMDERGVGLSIPIKYKKPHSN